MGLTYIEERMSAKDSKKIWVKIKRDKRVQPPKNEEGAQAEKPSGSTELSAELSNLADVFETKEFTLETGMSSKMIKKYLIETFGIDGERVVLKLRNLRGSLVPINAELAANSPTRPYTLEVCQRYENVKPRPRTVTIPTYEQMLKRRLQNISNRLSKLEQAAMELPKVQDDLLQKEIKELHEKMKFLDSRLKEADEHQWKGMFERHPLW